MTDMNPELEVIEVETPPYVPPSTEEASSNFLWTFGAQEVFHVQTTVRGAMEPEQIVAHLASVKNTMKAIVTLGGHAKGIGQQAQPAQAATAPTPAPVAAAAAPPAPATVPAPTSGGTPPSNGNGILTLLATRLEVTPRADGKVDAKFYEAGHKYPDLYMTRTATEIAGALAANGGGAWTPEHFATAASYDVKLNVAYRLSEKLNKNGKPYKDILDIRAAGGIT